MKQALKRNKTIVVLILTLLLCIVCSIFFFNKTEKANAEPVSSSFQMLPGLSVSLVSDNPKCAIAVSVTQDQYNKLYLNPDSAGRFLLAVVRVGSEEEYYNFQRGKEFFSTAKNVQYTLYHPSDTNNNINKWGKINKLQVFTEEGQEYYRLAIDLPVDYEKEYIYFACFLDEMGSGSLFSPYKLNINTKTNYTKRSIQYIANRSLEDMGDSLSEERLRLLQNYAGINVPTEKTTFYIQYEEWDRSGRAIQTSVESRKISSWKVGVNSLVISEMLDLLNKSNIADFDCVRVNGYSIDNIDYITDTKIIRQADDYVVNYDNDTQIGFVMSIMKI